MKVYYEETYGGYYDVEATTQDEAEKKLIDMIREGKEDGPETCENTVVCALIGTGNPDFQIMGARIDALSDTEKEFYLWHLIRYYYKKKLLTQRKEYENDRTTVSQINRLLNNVEEIDTLLCYEIF